VLRLALCGLAVVVAMIGGAALAGAERYDYDALGRLVRVIDEQGRVTEYVYDPAGNLLQVIVSGAGGAPAPAVTSISPGSIRRGETRSFVITGTGLTGARLSTSDPALEISALQASATQITFDLTVLASAPLGAHLFSLSNAAGSHRQMMMSPLPTSMPIRHTARPWRWGRMRVTRFNTPERRTTGRGSTATGHAITSRY